MYLKVDNYVFKSWQQLVKPCVIICNASLKKKFKSPSLYMQSIKFWANQEQIYGNLKTTF